MLSWILVKREKEVLTTPLNDYRVVLKNKDKNLEEGHWKRASFWRGLKQIHHECKMMCAENDHFQIQTVKLLVIQKLRGRWTEGP